MNHNYTIKIKTVTTDDLYGGEELDVLISDLKDFLAERLKGFPHLTAEVMDR